MALRKVFSLMVLMLVVVFATAQVSIEIGLSTREIGAVMDEHIANFEAQNPNINIKWLKVPGVPGQQHSQYVTLFFGKSDKPDIIAMDIIWPGEFASRGWLEPLDRFFPPSEQGEFIENMIEAAKYNGSVYGVPLYINGLHFYYRTDLLEKYGFNPPDTWEEVVKQATYIVEHENDPNLYGYISMWGKIEGLFMNYLQFLWGKGGDFFDENGNLNITSREAIEALQFMVDMIYKYKLAPQSIVTYTPDDARILFQQGRAVFMVVQDFVWPMLTAPDSIVRDKVDFKRVPYFEGHPDTYTVCLGGWLLGINVNSKYKEEAWKFIEYLTSHEAQLKTAVVTGSLPTRKSVYDDPKLLEQFPTANKQFEDFMVGNVRPSAQLGETYTRVSEIMQQEIQAALLRLKTPEKALNDAAKQIAPLLK
ncbi:ABC transporter substrate-binding protein [Petrotoga sp. 9PWA.NaAc.5.4]|uniref:ABC transporter substrate-binding protein n=1 Tax=Petrotoga sp. 9PWA.NaAc.5.4 TaxID=1434328 RepID=UPI000CB7E829|nr:ABC transporter substrate-binding protein [Petrotoga sp. 9PWA.NaAc.5.4]PNR92578.1 hypothetical protein X924_09745 [Petrotoga sp. 9PWA.NaAc.5.4]